MRYQTAAYLLLLAPLGLAQEPTATTTFHEHVAPIVFDHCVRCHREGEVAPFALRTYDDCRKRARMMVQVTRRGYMPPWHPVEGHGEFVGADRLSDDELATLAAWLEGGRLEGDPAKAPPEPTFPDGGWQLGEPDLVVSMAEAYPVPADGPDVYRNFVVPLGLDEDRWLTAIEVRPGSRAALHHIIFGFDTDGQARRLDGQDGKPGFDGMRGQGIGESTSGLGGWAVGGMPQHLPMGLARRVPAGADLILRSHLHPSGKAEQERTTLGLYFTDTPPAHHMVGLQLPPRFGVAAGLDVPAGASDFELRDSFELPVDCLGVTVGGHAHMICKEMELTVSRPGAEPESIFLIDDWDFDWQNRYQYVEPVDLPAGTRVDVRIRYDNSADNPNNPFDPPRRIGWGLQSTDEMGSVTLLLVAKEVRDHRALERAIGAKNREALRGDGARSALRATLLSRIRMADADGDGRITREECPERLRRGFERFDANGDGAIDAQELEAVADALGGRGRED